MKTTIGKLAVFSVVVALGIFMVVALVSAGGHPIPNAIRGQFAVTGGGSCIGSATFSSPDTLIATGPPPTPYSSNVMEGVYTFNDDGTGSYEGTVRVVGFLGGIPAPVFFGGALDFLWKFNYSVADDGQITFTNYLQEQTWTAGPQKGCTSTGDNGPLHGRISKNGYELTVTCGPGIPNPFINSTTNCGPPSQLMCIVNLAGYRK